MTELKTTPNAKSVKRFVENIEDERKRADCLTLLKMMKQVTRAEPKMWGDSIVGFGSYHYKYASGREGDWFLCGFSPRKQNLSVYIMCGLKPVTSLMKKLGKYKTGASCLYIKRLSDVDQTVLKDLLADSVRRLKASQK